MDGGITVAAHIDSSSKTFQQRVSVATKILNLDQARVVRSAGGVIARNGGKRPQVAVIHRPAYDDWTFPKGRSTTAKASRRPHCARSRRRRDSAASLCGPSAAAYVDHRGREKVACYWLMEETGGSFKPSKEVDNII